MCKRGLGREPQPGSGAGAPTNRGAGQSPAKKILTILSSNTQDIHRNLYEHRSRIKRSFPVGISHRREEERQEQQEQQEQQELQELQGTDRR